ncbi:hypothetical protein JCM1393_27600 [Clostridium carnis]
MYIKNFILKNKRIAICLVVALAMGFSGGLSNTPQAEYDNLVKQKEQLDSEIATLDEQLEESKAQVNELLAKKDEADRIAKAEEEAKVKVKAEAKAKEEADRIAKAEAGRLAQEQTQQESSQPTIKNVRMVWVKDARAKIYHSKSSCSKMSSPYQISYDDAEASGLRACKRCY